MTNLVMGDWIEMTRDHTFLACPLSKEKDWSDYNIVSTKVPKGTILKLVGKVGYTFKLEGGGMAYSTYQEEVHYKRLSRKKYNYYELLYGRGNR